MEPNTEYRPDAGRRERRGPSSCWDDDHMQHGNSGVWIGLFMLAVGGVLLARSFGVPMPAWLFSWQMLLIVIGLFIGARSGFRGGRGMVLILIGGLFLVNEFVLNGDIRKHIWPLTFIIMGVFFLLTSRNRWQQGFQKKNDGVNGDIIEPISEATNTHDDVIDIASIFGGTKKIILSKNFRGGQITNVFGGSEIDFTHADMQHQAVIDLTTIFGGATFIVPANWVVRSNATVIFGGINDKRYNHTFNQDISKTLILKGTVLFGGIDIKRF